MCVGVCARVRVCRCACARACVCRCACVLGGKERVDKLAVSLLLIAGGEHTFGIYVFRCLVLSRRIESRAQVSELSTRTTRFWGDSTELIL